MFNWRKPLLIFLLWISGQKSYDYFLTIQAAHKKKPTEKKRIQEDKLKEILLYAYHHVPYYTKILSKNKVIDENNTIDLEKFHTLPILNKDILRNEYTRLQDTSKHSRKTFLNTSGGSTGEPVKFVQDNVMWDRKVATKFYFGTFIDKTIGERELRLWGSERDLLVGKETLSKRIKNRLYNRVECNTFKMTEENMFSFVKKINTFKPKTIEAYVQSIYELAKFIKKNNLAVYSPQGGILTSAGTLYPDMEELIREVFQCKVINRYGSREVGDIACSIDGNEHLKTNVLQNYVEILDDAMQPVKVGESGKIYVTTLNNFSMPLIRYDIGDIGVRSEDEFEIFRVEGREMSMFKTRDGKLIPGEFFIHFVGVVYNNGGITKTQIVQEDYDHIKIKVIIEDKEIFSNDKGEIIQAIKKIMGDSCRVEFEEVDIIEPLASGKFLYTICKIT